MRRWKDMISGLLWLIFPRTCRVCGKGLGQGEGCFCRECLDGMPLTWFWQWKGNPGEERMLHLGAVRRVWSLFFYRQDSLYRNPVMSLKYRQDRRIGIEMGRMLGERMSSDPEALTIDAIVPVPLHWTRRLKRGYNQSHIIALGISEALGGVPVVGGCIVRRRNTVTQTRLGGELRRTNVKGAFFLKRPLPPGHILLVDDILTTGSTLEAVMEAAYRQRDVTLSIATLGITSP